MSQSREPDLIMQIVEVYRDKERARLREEQDQRERDYQGMDELFRRSFPKLYPLLDKVRVLTIPVMVCANYAPAGWGGRQFELSFFHDKDESWTMKLIPQDMRTKHHWVNFPKGTELDREAVKTIAQWIAEEEGVYSEPETGPGAVTGYS